MDTTIRWSRTALERTVLTASSLNLESVAEMKPEELDAVVRGSADLVVLDRKIPVKGLVIYDDPDGGGKIALITYPSGFTQRVTLGGQMVSERTAAGSSANIANALSRMGTQDVGILGAVGGGGDGNALIESLVARGLSDLLLLRRGTPDRKACTAQSLFLKTSDGTTIAFSLKPPYEIGEEGCAYLREKITSRIVICTGFLPYEFKLIEALLNTRAEPEARILSPHRGCFTTEKNRQRCLEFARRSTLFQINGYELQELFELEQGWENVSDQEVINLLRQIPAQLVCITLNNKGSVTYIRGQNRLLRQRSGEAKEINNPIGAGDVHLAALTWYLWLRERRVGLEAALKSAAWVAARKVEFSGTTPRPWDGIPYSEARKSVVHKAEEEFKDAPDWRENHSSRTT